MKILHINPKMNCGGIESMIVALANEMSKTQDVTVCSIYAPKEDDMAWSHLSTDVTRISCGFTALGASFGKLWQIYRTIKKGKYDIVNMHGTLYYYIVAIFLLMFTHTKFFYTVHSDAVRENIHWDKKIFWLKKLLFNLGIVHPITISRGSQRSFTQLYHCKSQLIFNGIAQPKINKCGIDYLKQYRKTPNTQVFLHAGRIDPSKNQVVLCRVFQRLIEEGEDVVLLIAGRIDHPEIFAELSPFFGERIQFLDNRNDIIELLSSVDAMCLPSIWEGLPVILLEALSVGCIPICSPVGGIVDVLTDGKNGLLSRSSQEEEYYQTIRRFLSMSDDERKLISKAAVDSFEQFRIETTAKHYIDYYSEIKIEADSKVNE